MPKGVWRKEEEKKEIVAKIQSLVDEGLRLTDACKRVGIQASTYYTYVNATKTKDSAPQPSVDIQFSVVSADEAKSWIPFRSGRFGALKEALIAQLKELRRTEAITFPAPQDADKRELTSIMVAINSTIKRSGMDFAARYSRIKNTFVIMRRDRLYEKKEKGE